MNKVKKKKKVKNNHKIIGTEKPFNGKNSKINFYKYQKWGKGTYSDLSNLMVSVWVREQKDVKRKQMGKEEVKPHLKITWYCT